MIPTTVNQVSSSFFVLLKDDQKLGVGLFADSIYDVILYLYFLSFDSFNNIIFRFFN